MLRSRRAPFLVLALLAAACDGGTPDGAAPASRVVTAPTPDPSVDDPTPPAATTTAPSRPRPPARVHAAPLACRDPGAGPEPDGGALKAFVNRRTRPLQACYEHALKRDAALRGRFTVRFTIGTCGEVSDLAVVKGHAPGELAGCITGALRAWKLPFRPAEPVEVEYPFSFAAR